MTYSFKHGEFEGPLDVLLDLIEARRLSITAVSLGKITDEYVVYIKSLSEFPLGEVSNFLVVASTLMLIKSRSLLPGLELEEEEERDIKDLEYRLKLLARIRELAKNIKDGWMRHPMFSREALKGYEFGFIEPKGVTADSLFKSLENLVKSFPKVTELPEKTLEKVISIEEKMIELVGRLTARIKATFHDIVGAKNKLDIIIGFLAVLELVKEGALAVRQDERFGNIEIEKNKNYE
ncbi:MAG: Segregation and condensation protein A [Candidatus Giovannonibacteria bacterium GW2011_GWA2_45_21]|uniref:Segregation and condensation protein A n=1 Tax=Candidatus Giovannonibacteria bacterium GW2011_GWA2_45_21 TaxID=1618649 RepID=A0A0G1M603_9BACT|nr:MAG: Segregation and condensation protein A [Candidatus Giovannonibacteria bacterium GW2011_GWA2_45_21]